MYHDADINFGCIKEFSNIEKGGWAIKFFISKANINNSLTYAHIIIKNYVSTKRVSYAKRLNCPGYICNLIIILINLYNIYLYIKREDKWARASMTLSKPCPKIAGHEKFCLNPTLKLLKKLKPLRFKLF